MAEFNVKPETVFSDEILSALSGSRIYPAAEYIFRHPEETLRLNKMADLCSLSPSYFSKLFVKDSGDSFTDFVCKAKVESARKMLSDTTAQISEIASSLGFSDASYFVKVFKKFAGVTPARYRRSLR